MGLIVAVTGSAEPGRRYDPPVRATGAAARAAEELGAELARQGCEILVYSADAAYLEAPAVRGYVRSGVAKPASVHVRGRYGRDKDLEFPEMADHAELFDVVPEVTGDWEVTYVRSLLTVDGLLALGGGQSTFIAGLLALSLRTPLAAVAVFGGGAEKVWRRLTNEPNYATAADVVEMARPWQPDSAARIVGSLVAQHARRAADRERSRLRERSAARRATGWLVAGAALLVAALGTIPLAFAWGPGSVGGIVALIVAPMLAASCGAIMRTAVDERSEWLRTTVLGAAAGVMVFLLFGAAQLTATPDVLGGTGAQRLIFFALPIGFVAGLTFDAVYRKLRSQDVTTALPTDPR